MVDDLIRKQAAIDAVGYYSVHSGDKLLFADNALKELPSAEPKKGKWIDIDSQMYTWKCRCSECGYERSMMSTQGRYPRFCENCGAYMER